MNLSYKYHILLTFFLFASTIINAQTYVNDDCSLANGEQGKCTKVEKLQKKVGEISKKKCLEYSFETPLTYADVIKLIDKYQITFAPTAINAFIFQFPHMAALGYGEENDISWLCAGSLISEKYVLTAAHCINPREKGSVKFVRLGDFNLKLTTDNAKQQNFKVARSIIHPGYTPPSVYNDIALIELSSAALFNRHVSPACLQTETTINETRWSATGWGLTSYEGSPADHLQKVELRSYTFEECQATYESTNTKTLKYGINATTQICAGELNTDTCKGDSGGPLQVYRYESWNMEHYSVIGVTSFGKACGIGDKPSVYTRVSYYIEWIESIVWP